MARSKKIICILICALMTALCAVSAFADPVQVFPDYYCWAIYEYGSGSPYRQVWRANVSLSNIPNTVMNLTNHPRFLLSYKLKETSEAVDYLSFQPGYTYSGTYQVNWYNSSNEPTSIDPTDGEYNIHLSLNADYLSSNNRAITTTIVDSPFQGVCAVTDLSDTYVDYNLSFEISFAFHVPDDFTQDDLYFLVLDCFYNFDPPYPSGTNSYVCVNPTSVSCFYDPDAGIIESETDKIIAGQLAAVQQAQQNELNATNSAASSNTDAAMNQASSAFNFSSFSGALAGLVSALGYTGSDFHFYLPAADNIPYIGSLWSQQEIPLKTMIDSIPVGLLYVLRFLAWLALIFSVVHFIRKLVSDINGGGDD